MKATKLWLTTVAVLLCSLTASAHDFAVSGIYYNITSSTDLTVRVTFKGSTEDEYYHEYYGAVTIPATVTYNSKTYRVTGIGDSAFEDCSSLTSITIPKSVTGIGYSAFEDCSSLTSITIPESVTWIGNNAFYGCSSLTSITIPESVTSIGLSAFCDCSSLTSITIPEGVKRIGDYAFGYCSNLTSITIPKSVTYIGENAFYYCSNLTSITIPESVTWIDFRAFYGCENLKRVINLSNLNIQKGSYENGYVAYYAENVWKGDGIIGDYIFTLGAGGYCLSDYIGNETNLTLPSDYNGKNYSIGAYAFYGCSSLASITIPESVTSIENGAFYDCSSLTSITIPESVTSIGLNAFYGCTSLTSINIPKSVTSIGSDAFYNCSSLTSITVAEGNTVYDSREGCNAIIETASNTLVHGISTTIIPESVTSIGSRAFSGCSSLTSITIPEGVTSIGTYAFSSCTSLTDITVAEGNTIYDSRSGCNAIIETNSNTLIAGCSATVIPESVTSIGGSAFSGCTSLTSINIPKSVTSIGGSAFSGCTSLTSITIPEGVTSIGNMAFYNCSSLTSITIPESVTSIGLSAFSGCTSLTSINIPKSVTSIGGSAFSGCTSLTSITIPESVTSIGDLAFDHCSSLTSITVAEGNTVYDSREGCNAIIETASNTLVHGISTTIIPESVTSIGSRAFSGCSSLTSITIPEGVTSIGDMAFLHCSSLTSITIPESVTSIGLNAFYGCTGELIVNCNIPSDSIFYFGIFEGSAFTKVTIGDKVTSIGDSAFEDCSSLTSITISESVKFIGEYAFYGCENLKKVINCSNLNIQKGSSNNGYVAYYAEKVWIGDGVIDDYVFTLKDGVYCLSDYIGDDTDLTLPEDYKGDDYKIYELAFKDNKDIVSVSIPQTVGTIGRSAFSGCSNLASVKLARGVMEIENKAFENCTSLTEVIFPESLTAVGQEAFKGCSGVKTLYVNPNVETFGKNAFEGCTAVETLTVMGNVMPTVPSDELTSITMRSPLPLETEAFANKVYRNATLYVPEGSLERYQSADVWKNFWTIKEFDPTYKDVTSVNLTIDKYGSGTFCSMYSLDFSDVAGLKAYVATGYNTATGVVTFTRVMTAKPGEGLFVKGTPGDYEVPTIENPENFMQNLLVGTLENTIVNSTSKDGLNANYEYTIKSNDTTPLFYRIVDGSVQNAGKAYLQLPKVWIGTGATRAIGLHFDDEEMKFDDEEQSANDDTPAVIYDLQGRRVTTPTKGVFIVNGKKVVFK